MQRLTHDLTEDSPAESPPADAPLSNPPAMKTKRPFTSQGPWLVKKKSRQEGTAPLDVLANVSNNEVVVKQEVVVKVK